MKSNIETPLDSNEIAFQIEESDQTQEKKEEIEGTPVAKTILDERRARRKLLNLRENLSP